MNNRIAALGCLAAVSLFSSAQAIPVTTVFKGVVDDGKTDFTGSLVDIAGLPYEVRITGDTTQPDLDPGDTARGAFFPLASTEITIEGVGTVVWNNPDLFRKIDDGVTASLFLTWAAGLEGGITIHAPTGTFGDPNALVPFPLFDLTGIAGISVQIGSSVPPFQGPKDKVWFNDFDPISVSASIPDSGSTLTLMAVASIACGVLRLPRRRA